MERVWDRLPCVIRIFKKQTIADSAAGVHSMSLTLAYADGKPWALRVEDNRLPEHKYFKVGKPPDYGGNFFASYPMQPDDAVRYKGVAHRHG